MIVSVHQPQYIPWLGYIDKIARSDHFVFLDCVQYKEREFQNRNRIRTRDGWIWLSVPVISGGRQAIGDVAVDNEAAWQRKHLGSLLTWYGAAPHFKEYAPFFEDVYSREWQSLSELNIHIIRFLMKALTIYTPITFESELNIGSTSTQRIIDICKALKADAYLSGSGGRAYMDEALFPANSIRLEYQEYYHPAYRQLHEPFEPYMSVIDLLFNHGKESAGILLGKGK